MTTLPTWLAIYLGLGTTFTLWLTNATFRAKAAKSLTAAGLGRPHLAACIALVAFSILAWPLVILSGLRKRKAA